jgi:hypothetical protein
VTVYADSSALVKLYVPEQGHDEMRAIIVGREVEVSVAAQRGQDHGLLAGLLVPAWPAGWPGRGVGGLRRRDDALGARELHGRREALGLRDGLALMSPCSYTWLISGAMPW